MLVYQSFNSRQQQHIRMDYYRDFSYMRHLHRDLEFVLVVEGEIQIDVDNRREIARKGDLALLLPNQVHAFLTTDHSYTLICPFSGDLVNTFMRQIEGKTGQYSVFHCDDGLFTYLLNRYDENGPMDAMTVKATLYAVCAQYLRCVPLTENKQKNDDLLNRMLDYIEQNYKDDISMKTAALSLGYNESYLSRYFHGMVGMNFRQFINQYRIEYACHLMNRGNTGMADIALESGFQNIRSFNRAFKTVVGKTPSEYK